MELITTADDVEKMQGDGFFLLQCPRTGVVYLMTNKVINNGDNIYYLVKQQPESRFVVDTSYHEIGRTEERYYFSTERLKEMITNKSFAIER